MDLVFSRAVSKKVHFVEKEELAILPSSLAISPVCLPFYFPSAFTLIGKQINSEGRKRKAPLH